MTNTTEKELQSHVSTDGQILKAVFCLGRGNSNGLSKAVKSKVVKDRTKILIATGVQGKI